MQNFASAGLLTSTAVAPCFSPATCSRAVTSPNPVTYSPVNTIDNLAFASAGLLRNIALACVLHLQLAAEQ